MFRFRRQLSTSSGLFQSTFLALGNVAASGFSAISLIILSRYLGPREFGGFSVAFSLTQLMARILDFGFNTSLQRFVARTHHHDSNNTAAAVYEVGIVKLVSVAIAIVFGLVAGPWLARTFFHVSQPILVTLGTMLAASVLLYEYVVAILQAMAKFMMAIVMNGSQALVKCTAAVISYLALPPNSIVAYTWYGLAPLVSAVIGWFSIPKQFKAKVWSDPVWNEILTYMKFGAVGVLAAAIGDNVDVLMVNASLSEFDTGLYSAAARVALMVTMFGMSFGTVFNTRAAKYQNQKDLHTFLTKAIAFAVVSIILIPLSILLAKPLILLTAGSKYLGAIMSMNYLMASAFFMMAAMPFIAVFYAVDYPAYFAISGIIQTVVLIASNAILIPRFGITGAGMAKCLTRFIVAVYTIWVAYHHAKHQFKVHRPSFQELRDVIHV